MTWSMRTVMTTCPVLLPQWKMRGAEWPGSCCREYSNCCRTRAPLSGHFLPNSSGSGAPPSPEGEGGRSRGTPKKGSDEYGGWMDGNQTQGSGNVRFDMFGSEGISSWIVNPSNEWCILRLGCECARILQYFVIFGPVRFRSVYISDGHCTPPHFEGFQLRAAKKKSCWREQSC